MFEKSKRSLVAATRGGTYRVRDSSTMASGNLNGTLGKSHVPRSASASQRAKTLAITVVFLDDSQHTFEVEKSAKGSVLLDKVYQHLELIERDYFGLQFDELLPPPEVTYPLSSPHLRWIESSKQLKKQIRFSKPENSRSSSKKSSIASTSSSNGNREVSNNGGNNHHKKSSGTSQQSKLPSATVYFRVKFFVEDPARLQEEYTRYHVFLQLRKDILEGRLIITPSTACLLSSYAFQSELGDFNPDEHTTDGYYLRNSEANLLLSTINTPEYLRKICELHKLHKGQTPADAEFNFLTHAKRLESYGVSFHRVKDNLGKEIQVGVSSLGISVYHNGIKINTFSWSKITKIAFKRKHFFIQLRREMSEEYDTLLLFDCWSYRSCKRLWKCCVENHAFFRCSAPPPPNRRPTLLLLALGSRFRYSGRTEYQTRENVSSSRSQSRERRTFFRSPSKKLLFIRQTLSGKSGSAGGDNQEKEKDINIIQDSRYNRESSKEKDERDKENLGGSSHSQYYQVSQQQPQHHHPALQQYGVSNGVSSVRDSRGDNVNINLSNVSVTTVNRSSGGASLRAISTGFKVHQSTADEKTPRQAWQAEQNLSDDEGGFLDRTGIILPQSSTSTVTAASNTITNISLLAKGIAFADDDENSQSDDGTVSIRLEPDNQGKFGFNVKGGCDMGCPVLVSRVAIGTPADQGYPRLNEGDQIIQINGKDTTQMSHREIVNTIRNAATVRKELMLRVRQNVYSTEDFEEPAFQYVPDVPLLHMTPETGSDTNVQSALASSMLLLAEALDSGSITSQFELVFRRKPGMSCDVAKLPENVNKNRYRDISPYDSTRVILNSCPNGDYINANYVTMEIVASGIVNRYIATQGPLSSTCVDFWIMVWETQSPLIVMLTPICEHGRVKCHPYWPQHLNSSVVYHNLQVTTIQERNLPLWTRREFQIKNLETDEERVVVQLLYQSWPDHSIPESSSFIRFIEEVRKTKVGTVEPTIVHCSAGIGRTGVLILMETAIHLIEANSPIYPLDIVTQMRLQRPLMIQTPSQYSFVCQCVYQVYQKRIVKPLPEFSVQGNSPPSQLALTSSSSSSTAPLGTRARQFCSSLWFHNNIQQQNLQNGSIS